MSLKEFIYPTKWKIITSLLLIVILEILILWIGSSLNHCFTCGIYNELNCPPCNNYKFGFHLAGYLLIPVIIMVYLLISFVFLFLRKNN